MRRLLVAPVLAFLFVAAPPSVASESPPHFESPEKGYARLYVFRPGFSEDLREESPVVMVNGSAAFQLPYKSYSSLMLKPGAHEISTRPNTEESEIWNGRIKMSLDEDRVYFLAVWNDTTFGAGSLGAVTPYLGLLGVLMDQTERSMGVRFELVTEKDAAASLKGMSHVPSRLEEKP